MLVINFIFNFFLINFALHLYPSKPSIYRSLLQLTLFTFRFCLISMMQSNAFQMRHVNVIFVFIYGKNKKF